MWTNRNPRVAGGNVKWCSRCGKVWQFIKMLNWSCYTIVRYVPWRNETYPCKTCSQMFIASLLIAQKCKQFEEWVHKMWFIYTMELVFSNKKEWRDATYG